VNKKNLNNNHDAGSLFSILLFFLFTLCMVFVMVIGANVYQNIVERMDDNFGHRTALAYITNKVRQYDRADSISVVTVEGQEVLELKSEANGAQYQTLIYCLDGEIRELYKLTEDELPLSAGIGIIEVESASFKLYEDTLLSILVEGADGEQLTYIKLRSGE